jgi:hypothetical protein
VLTIHHDLELPRDGFAAIEHVAQRFGAGRDRFRMAREQLKEALFPRQQCMKPAQHVGNDCRWRTCPVLPEEMPGTRATIGDELLRQRGISRSGASPRFGPLWPKYLLGREPTRLTWPPAREQSSVK